MSKNSKKRKRKNKKQNVKSYYTLGSRARTSEKILKDNHKCYKNAIHLAPLSQTLQAGLTIKEEAYRSFFTSSAKDLSRKLWLPKEIDSLDLLTNSSRKFSNSTQPKSWFTVKTIQKQNQMNEKSWTTFCPLIHSSLQDYKDKEQLRIENEEKQLPRIKKILTKIQNNPNAKLKRPELVSIHRLQMKTFNVRLYFDKAEKQVLKQWFGVSRMIYNKVIEYFRLNNKKPTKEFMRTWINEKNKEYIWFKDVPYNLKDETYKQAFASIEGKETRSSQGKKSGFIGFRTKKDLRQVIPVRTKNINYEQFKIYPRALIDACKDLDSSYKRVKKKSHQDLKANWIKQELQAGEKWSDCVLQRHSKSDRWVLSVHYTYPMGDQVRDNQTTEESEGRSDCSKFPLEIWNSNELHIAAYDPGVKTFATIYSPTDKLLCKVGQGDYNRLSRLRNAYYKIIRKISKFKGKERKKHKHSHVKAAHRILFKIKSLVGELHRKLASWLVKTFDLIIVPPFNEKCNLSKKPKKGKWDHKETRVNILSWCHGAFRKRLDYECKKYGKVMYIQEESYTSKTCTSCGWINERLGNADVMICKNRCCSLRAIDRDLNGARNICIKGLYNLLYSV